MNLARLRAGEVTAGVGAISLFILLFLHWAKPEESVLRDPGADLPSGLNDVAERAVGAFVDRLAQTGFATLGWFMVLMLLSLIVTAGTLVVLTVTERDTPVLSVVAANATTAWGIIVAIVLFIRLTLAQPDLGLGLPDDRVNILPPAQLGFLAVVLIAAGGWLTLRDDRTESALSEAPPVPVRPAPPATAA